MSQITSPRARFSSRETSGFRLKGGLNGARTPSEAIAVRIITNPFRGPWQGCGEEKSKNGHVLSATIGPNRAGSPVCNTRRYMVSFCPDFDSDLPRNVNLSVTVTFFWISSTFIDHWQNNPKRLSDGRPPVGFTETGPNGVTVAGLILTT